MSQPDYYRILGVSCTASEREIKVAYRRLARRYHPDLNPNNPRAEEILKAINEAHEVLGDRVQRRHYDAQWADVVYATATPRWQATPSNPVPPSSAQSGTKNAADSAPFLYVHPASSYRPYALQGRMLWIVLVFAGFALLNILSQQMVRSATTPVIDSAAQRVIDQDLSGPIPATQILLPHQDEAVQIDHLLPGQKVILRYWVLPNAGQAYVGVKNVPSANGRETSFVKGKWITINNNLSRGQLEIPISVEGNYVVFAQAQDFIGTILIKAQIVQP